MNLKNYAQTPELSLVDYEQEARIVIYQRGYRTGFNAGVSTRVWLATVWPWLMVAATAAGMGIGLLL